MKNDDTAAPSEGFIYPEPTDAMRLAFNAARGSWFDKMRAALAVALVGGEPATGYVRHLKRGSVYAVLGEATAQVSTGEFSRRGETGDELERPLCDGEHLVVYVGTDGRLWVRFSDEMNDGRFAPLAPGEFHPSDDHGSSYPDAAGIAAQPGDIERPLTARDLADAFGCMWNAAIEAAHRRSGGMDCACILAEGFAAMSARLNEISDEKGTGR